MKAGLNRLVWNVRHDQAVPVPGLYVFGTLQGRQALPGDYQVRLTRRRADADRAFDGEDGSAGDHAARRTAGAGRAGGARGRAS